MNQIILASGSPRRKEILEQVGLSFDIKVSNKEEIITKTDPKEVVKELALQKAMDIMGEVVEGTIIIGADTVVVHNNQILGKPRNKEHARKIITDLSGGYHEVYTGVALILKEKEHLVITFYESTKVYVSSMTEDEIEEYINSTEPYDKAGAYGIQGLFAKYIEKIEGDYYNVVGLPVCRLMKEIKKWR